MLDSSTNYSAVTGAKETTYSLEPRRLSCDGSERGLVGFDVIHDAEIYCFFELIKVNKRLF